MNTYIVIDEHTLAVIVGDKAQILRASVLRGSTYPNGGWIDIPTEYRVATVDDFNDYRVEYPI